MKELIPSMVKSVTGARTCRDCVNLVARVNVLYASVTDCLGNQNHVPCERFIKKRKSHNESN